jgi:hypothetical protein
MKEHAQRLVDAAAPIGWLAWIFSHMTEINQVLQFVLLLASIFATVSAGLYHRKKRKELDQAAKGLDEHD